MKIQDLRTSIEKALDTAVEEEASEGDLTPDEDRIESILIHEEPELEIVTQPDEEVSVVVTEQADEEADLTGFEEITIELEEPQELHREPEDTTQPEDDAPFIWDDQTETIEPEATEPVQTEEIEPVQPLEQPQEEPGAMKEESPAPPAGAAPQKPYILLVEDNKINQRIATLHLEKLGCHVELAENGEEALNRRKAERFDLMFMDIMMPVMDGLEATRQIRLWEHSQDAVEPVYIIAMTANAMKGDRESCLQAGMNEYISKPFKAEELQKVLHEGLK